jgi:putative endonuclease
MKTYWLYIILCSDGSFYTGSTSNLEKRMSEHELGTFEGYTSHRRPVRLVFSQMFNEVRYCIFAERQVKNWSHGKKQALIDGDFDLLHELAKCKNVTSHRNRKLLKEQN